MTRSPWLLSSLVLLAACGGGADDDDGPRPDADSIDARVVDARELSLGGTISGLPVEGGVVHVELSGVVTDLTVASDGPFMVGRLEAGMYRVTATAPGRQCGVARGQGSLTADVTGVLIECQAPDLRITELGTCFYAASSCWFEVHNTSDEPRNLADYTLRSSASRFVEPYTALADQTFPLPSLPIAAGERALVRGRIASAFAGPQVALVDGVDETLPWWSQHGVIELVRDARTIDFVRFGNSVVAPTSAGWEGSSVTALPSGELEHGRALARSLDETDTDSRDDWSVRAFGTPGGPNDITSDTDADGDGVPDESEVAGGTFSGLDLYAMGARTGRRDLFLELDYMDSTDPGVKPERGSLDLVVAAFARHDIALHIDVGAAYAPAFDPAAYNLGNAAVVPYTQQISLGPSATAANVYELKATHFDVRRSQLFYYMVSGAQSDVGGRAELFGNDAYTSVGYGPFDRSSPAEIQRLVNGHADVIFHEFGHNLGLDHGGDEARTFKPNYISAMNYQHSYVGEPVIGQAEGDRYYLRRGCFGTTPASLVRGPYSADFHLDYSSGDGAALDEAQISETSGLGRPTSGPVDFNCNGVASGGYQLDLNGDGQISMLTDHDDWGNLRFAFARRFQGQSRLRHARIDPLVDDRQPLADEAGFSPPPAR